MTSGSDPYAVVRPRRGRRVAIGFGVASLLVFGGLAVLIPATGSRGWGVVDSAGMVGFGLAIAALMWRFATLRAVPSRDGVVVRNVLLTRSLSWDEIARVRFGGGDPWVTLDLVDGEQLAVMGVQKSDGAFGRAEASRLTALLQVHSGNRPQTPPIVD